MSKSDCKDYICRPYCRFFREGEKEEMECRGAEVIEKFISTGKLNSENFPVEIKSATLWENRDKILKTYVCENCEFVIDGCDYQSKSPPKDAEPCGGYILLTILKKHSFIITRDLKDNKIE